MASLDWRNIDFAALAGSNVVRGALVVIVGGVAKMALGHDLDANSTAQIADQVLTVVMALGGLWAGWHRVIAQPETVATIVPKKPPAN